MDALTDFPKRADILKLTKGEARLIKTDIFKRKMWYAQPNSSALIAMSIEQVKHVQELNKRGEYPEDLTALSSTNLISAEIGFEDGVGATSLSVLDEAERKKKERERNRRRKNKRSRRNKKNSDN
jgi:hypothetical protein